MSSAVLRFPAATAEAPRHDEAIRIAEAMLFASAEPLRADDIGPHLPEGCDVGAVLAELQAFYAPRGVNLVPVAGKWVFRTASDLAYVLAPQRPEPRRLSRAALETLAIIAYHQPVTRAEIEEVRGVATSKGTLDTLLDAGWIRLRARRRTPGRPVTYGTTPAFLEHFGLDAVGDLPGLDELKGAGFLEGNLASNLSVPLPSDDPLLRDDEEALEEDLFASVLHDEAGEAD